MKHVRVIYFHRKRRERRMWTAVAAFASAGLVPLYEWWKGKRVAAATAPLPSQVVVGGAAAQPSPEVPKSAPAGFAVGEPVARPAVESRTAQSGKVTTLPVFVAGDLL